MLAESAFRTGYLYLPLLGFIIAVLATMSGGGGGFLFVPVLVLFYSVPTHTAIATSLAVTIPVGLVASIEQYRTGNINIRSGLTCCLAGVAGALSGAFISALISPDSLKRVFGVYAIVLAAIMVFTGTGTKDHLSENETRERNALQRIIEGFCGLVSGMIAGIFGTSGAAPVIAGLYITKSPVRIIIGTSTLVVLTNSVSGLAGHLAVGRIDIMITILLGTGAAFGAFFGPFLLRKINLKKMDKVFRLILILLVLIVGIIMTIK